MGFVLSPDEAAAMIAADPRNADVVRPYLVGEDLNSATGRLAVAVGDRLPRLARGAGARRTREPFARVEALVRQSGRR